MFLVLEDALEPLLGDSASVHHVDADLHVRFLFESPDGLIDFHKNRFSSRVARLDRGDEAI